MPDAAARERCGRSISVAAAEVTLLGVMLGVVFRGQRWLAES